MGRRNAGRSSASGSLVARARLGRERFGDGGGGGQPLVRQPARGSGKNSGEKSTRGGCATGPGGQTGRAHRRPCPPLPPAPAQKLAAALDRVPPPAAAPVPAPVPAPATADQSVVAAGVRPVPDPAAAEKPAARPDYAFALRASPSSPPAAPSANPAAPVVTGPVAAAAPMLTTPVAGASAATVAAAPPAARRLSSTDGVVGVEGAPSARPGGARPGAVEGTFAAPLAPVPADRTVPTGPALVAARSEGLARFPQRHFSRITAQDKAAPGARRYAGSSEGVLSLFQMDRVGSQVQITDTDGSIYKGSLLVLTSSLASAPTGAAGAGGVEVPSTTRKEWVPASSAAVAPPGQPLSLYASGTNHTSKQKVVFLGTLSETNNRAWIRGSLRIGARAGVPIEAVEQTK